MILFIFGPSHVGKTALASTLSYNLGIPFISMDLIKMGLIKSGMTSLTPVDDDKLQDLMWPMICGMAKTALENEQDYIIEGDYLPENWQSYFKDNADKVGACAIVMSKSYIRENYDNIIKWRNVVEKRHHEAPSIEQMIKDGEATYERCNRNGEIINMIERNYESATQLIMHYIAEMFDSRSFDLKLDYDD